jgi:sugar/nucleoside kinase (ribokinase family)
LIIEGSLNNHKPFDVLTFGDLCVDLIVSGEDVKPQFGQVEKLVGDYTLEMGGSCSLFACQAARLGLRTAILGRVGDDSFGRLVVRRLQECGVDTRYVTIDPQVKTGLGIALCQSNDRAILTYMGTINILQPGDVTDDLLVSARHLHHGSYYLHTGLIPGIPGIFKRAKQLGLSTSLDPNWDPQELWDANLAEMLPYTDILMPNEQEARFISHRGSVVEAITCFHMQGVPLVTIKLGAQGALVDDGQATLRHAGTPVSGGDSIGAGDSFDAGFLAGWLRNQSLERCLELANACGSSVASQVGGLAGQLRFLPQMGTDER